MFLRNIVQKATQYATFIFVLFTFRKCVITNNCHFLAETHGIHHFFLAQLQNGKKNSISHSQLVVLEELRRCERV